MEEENVFEKLLELFTKRRFADLRMTLLDMEAADIAAFIEEELDEKEQIVFFRLLGRIRGNRFRHAGRADQSLYR